MPNDQLMTKVKRYLTKKPYELALYLIFALAVLKLFGLYSEINDHEDNWSEFKQQHHCQLKKNADGNAELGWQCDDGKTYYRWRQFQR